MSYFAQQSQHPKPWLTDPKLKSQYNPIKEAEREIKMKKKCHCQFNRFGQTKLGCTYVTTVKTETKTVLIKAPGKLNLRDFKNIYTPYW